MKSKKAFLLGEHTLKIVIAVLCLLLLVYLLFRLYSNSQDERNRQLAESSLNELVAKMGEAKETGESQEMVLLNPKAPLGYWKKGEKGPEGCLSNCLCFCTGAFSAETHILDDRINICMKPVCKNFDEEAIIKEDSIWGLPQDIKIEYKDNKFTISKK